MTDLIILKVPEDISARARQIAEAIAQPVEQLLLDHLKTRAAPLPVLPPDTQFEWVEGGTQVHGLSPIGRATVTRLKMNRPAIVVARQRWAAGGYHPPETA
jgi:hypothetical protein